MEVATVLVLGREGEQGNNEKERKAQHCILCEQINNEENVSKYVLILGYYLKEIDISYRYNLFSGQQLFRILHIFECTN